MAHESITVIGAGIIGLTAALSLSDAGYKVFIVARNWPGDFSTEWASPWAGALLAPHPDAQYPDLIVASLTAYKHLMKHEPLAGVKELHVTECYDDRPHDTPVWYEKLVPNFQRIDTSLLPTGTTVGYTYSGLVANPNQLLPWLMERLAARKVIFITTTVGSFQEVRALTGSQTIVNASGLGARELASDDAVHSVRGQTIFAETPKVDQVLIRQGSQYTYVIPRPSDGGVILGGVTQSDNFDTNPSASVREDILRRIDVLSSGSFADIGDEGRAVKDLVGFRPARKGGIRLEKESDVIHAYGLGSLGYLYAFGVARKVLELIGELPKSRL